MTTSINPARRVGPDFHLVKLTPHGEALAAGNPVHVTNGRISLKAVPGEQHKVARYEWDMLLRDHVTPAGKPMFAVVAAADDDSDATGEAAAEEQVETSTEEKE
jgi:hypothetical protein